MLIYSNTVSLMVVSGSIEPLDIYSTYQAGSGPRLHGVHTFYITQENVKNKIVTSRLVLMTCLLAQVR